MKRLRGLWLLAFSFQSLAIDCKIFEGKFGFQGVDVNWRKGLSPALVRQIEIRLKKFFDLGGIIVHADLSRNNDSLEPQENMGIRGIFSYDSNGTPLIQISRKYISKPKEFGEILGHELDHFTRFDRFLRKLTVKKAGKVDLKVLQAYRRASYRTQKGIPSVGSHQILRELEAKAKEFDFSMTQSYFDQEMRELNDALSSLRTSTPSDEMSSSLAKLEMRSLKIRKMLKKEDLGSARVSKDIYPIMSGLKAIEFSSNIAPLTKELRLNLVCDDLARIIVREDSYLKSIDRWNLDDINESFENYALFGYDMQDPIYIQLKISALKRFQRRILSLYPEKIEPKSREALLVEYRDHYEKIQRLAKEAQVP